MGEATVGEVTMAADGEAERQDNGGAAGTSHPAPPDRGSAALTPGTLRAYRADWAAFQAWCRQRGQVALPAAVDTVEAHLLALAATRGRSTLDRRLAAVLHRHRSAGCPLPNADPSAARRLLAAKRRARGSRRKPPPTPAQLRRMAASCPGDLAGLRDRALLLLLARTGLRRAALVSLDRDHVDLTPAACTLSVPGGSAPARIVLPRLPEGCAVRALQDWLRASDCRFGPVFRKVDRWGNAEHRPLGADALRRILARRAKALRRLQPRRRPIAAAA